VTESSTEILRHLYFHGGVWAQPESYEIFIRPQQMIVPRGTVGGYMALIGLQAFPVALLTYSGGLGAIAGRNYGLLRDLLSLRFEHQGRERRAIESLAYSVSDAGDLPQSLHGERRHTPMSDHLAGLLEPMAAGYVADPELLFDTLAIMIALTWLDNMDPLPTEPQYLPWGRYVWKGHMSGRTPVAVVLGEAETQGAAWAPLKAGMFGGSTSRFQAVRALFDASMVNAARHFR
jgi:hypothetical protein